MMAKALTEHSLVGVRSLRLEEGCEQHHFSMKKQTQVLEGEEGVFVPRVAGPGFRFAYIPHRCTSIAGKRQS